MADSASEAWRIDELREEARYRRERLQLYRARIYAGRASSEERLREYQRAFDGAAARLRRAEAQPARATDSPRRRRASG